MKINSSPLKILVTGASGFIGQAVVSELCNQGYNVVAMVRRSEQAEVFEAECAVTTVIADITDSATLLATLQCVDAVIHLAGIVWGDSSQMHKIFVEGTENLINAMHQAAVSHLILVSSVLVYDWSKVSDTVDENSAVALEQVAREQGVYSQAKMQQEAVAQSFCNRYVINLTVLRPGAVVSVNKFDTADLGLRIGPLQIVVAPLRRLRLVNVKHVAETSVAACSANLPNGLIINLVDNDPITAWEFACHLRRISRKYGLIFPIPYKLIMVIAQLIYPLAKLLALDGYVPGLLSPDKIASRFKSVTFDNSIWQKYLPFRSTCSPKQPLSNTFLLSGEDTSQ